MAKLNAEQLADIWNSLQNGRISVGDTKRLFEHIDSLKAEIAALREPMACGHPKACQVEDKNSLSHLDSFYRRQIDKGMFNEDQIDSLRRDNSHCTACEHERHERTAALREAAEIAHNEKNGDNRVIEERILALTDRSALDAYVQEKVAARDDEWIAAFGAEDLTPKVTPESLAKWVFRDVEQQLARLKQDVAEAVLAQYEWMLEHSGREIYEHYQELRNAAANRRAAQHPSGEAPKEHP